MTTLTLTLDDTVAKRASQAALKKHASLEELLFRFVVNLGQDDAAQTVSAERESAAHDLLATFHQLSRPLGGKGYTSRDELYER